QLYCCHYKSDKAARTLSIIGKENESHYIHIQCAAWNPDIDTSHLPFTTTLRKVKASWNVCCFCLGRFGYQLHCAHVEDGVPCDYSFHPMCAFRHGFLPSAADYNAKYNICYCPTHASDANTALSAESRRIAASHEEELASSLSRRRTLPSYTPTDVSSAAPTSDTKSESVRLSTVQEWPTRGSYRTSRLGRRSSRPEPQSATTTRRAGRLPFSLNDDASDATRSEVSPITPTTVAAKRRGRPPRESQPTDIDGSTGVGEKRRARASTNTTVADIDLTEEESVIGSGFVRGTSSTHSSSRRGSLVREANAKSPKSSKVPSRAPSVERGDQLTSVGPKLKLSLGRIAKTTEAGAVQTSSSVAASGSTGKGAPLPTARPTITPLPPVSSTNAPPILQASGSSDQLSPYAAFVKRPNIRIKPFSQASSMSPIAATTPGAYPHLAASRGYGPLTPSADSHAKLTPTFELSSDQANMLKESHSMLQKQNEMLSSICDMVKGLSINPAQKAQEAMGAISSLSALVSGGTAPYVTPGNGLLAPSASGPSLLTLPQQQNMPHNQYVSPAQPQLPVQTRPPASDALSTQPIPAQPSHARPLVQMTAPLHTPSFPTSQAPPTSMPLFGTPSVESSPRLPANRHHGFKPIMPSQGPREIAPWTGAPANMPVAKKRRTSSSNEHRASEHRGNGSGPLPSVNSRCSYSGSSPSLSPMNQPMSPGDTSRNRHSEATLDLVKNPLAIIPGSPRQPFMRSTCVQAGPTMLDYANPIVDMDMEMDELKENIIYLIQRLNVPQILLDMLETQSASLNAANEASACNNGQIDSEECKRASNFLVSELKALGKLTTYNVTDCVRLLVDSLQAMKRSSN
ncbi:hypothetical protein GGH95_001958, partial [Coemansia sp. RSA 1836]